MHEHVHCHRPVGPFGLPPPHANPPQHSRPLRSPHLQLAVLAEVAAHADADAQRRRRKVVAGQDVSQPVVRRQGGGGGRTREVAGERSGRWWRRGVGGDEACRRAAGVRTARGSCGPDLVSAVCIFAAGGVGRAGGPPHLDRMKAVHSCTSGPASANSAACSMEQQLAGCSSSCR